MEMPEGGGVAGGIVAIAATIAALLRHHLKAFFAALFGSLLSRATHTHKAQSNAGDRLWKMVDNIADRVRKLEEKATEWKVAETTNTHEMRRLQEDVERTASKIGSDMSGLRDLLLEILKRTH